jgi:hypothetical protein
MSPLRAHGWDAKFNAEATLLPGEEVGCFYVPAEPMGGRGQGRAGGRAFLHGGQPALRANVHVRLKSALQVEAASNDGRWKRHSRRERGDTFYPLAGQRCAPRSARNKRPAVLSRSPTTTGTWIAASPGAPRRLSTGSPGDFRWGSRSRRRWTPAPSAASSRVPGAEPLCRPCTYKVQLAKRINGVPTDHGPAAGVSVCAKVAPQTPPSARGPLAALAAFQGEGARPAACRAGRAARARGVRASSSRRRC